jgi:4-amino-4-deoxy-L-arabinose transferase-like glycosyltransferase
MSIASPKLLAEKATTHIVPASREKSLRLLALVAIVVLAGTLRFVNLEALGYGNHYYTAAVKSMLVSWHNFFYAAAEPGGSVSVDKPPVGLWLQAISAYFLGVSGFSVLLPQILAGIISVIVVYHLVRRSFGTVAGLLAGLALAITPVAVVTDRNNTIDSTLVLALLLAAWAFIKATETGRLRYLLLGAFLVGVGFNIKMLEAYLPLPAFYALYFLGSRENLRAKLGKLALASLLLLAVSFSWVLAVDLTPADQRPYVGSSGDNSEMTLAIGYNGLNRLLGMSHTRSTTPARQASVSDSPQHAPPRNGTSQAPGSPPSQANRPSNNNGQPPRNQPRGNVSRTPSNIGQPGALRLFTTPLSKEMGWLLPFGAISMGVLLLGSRLQWPLAPKHQALVLWGGWLVTGGVFFSIAEFFHEYYLIMLCVPLAALVGIGVVELWNLRARRPWLAIALILVAVGSTLGLQVYTAQAYTNAFGWLPVTLGVFIVGAVLLIAFAKSQSSRTWAVAGFTLVVVSMLITPGIWSALTTMNPGSNASLPSAYSGKSSKSTNGSIQVNTDLLDYLEANTQDTTYLMAVPTSMQGADYVIATGRPVLYLGGFKGQDQVVTTDELAQMVQQGELRYIYGNSRGNGTQSDISAWISTNCTLVQGFDTTTRNAGAPDGTSMSIGDASQSNARSPGGTQSISLYQCGN